jgi:hypothetical protein
MTPAPDARQISERSLFKNRLASAFLLSLGALACLLVGSRTDDVRVLGPGILLAIASAIVLLAAIETAAYAPDGELRALAQHLRRLDPVESVRARHRDDAGRTRAVPHGGLSFAFGIVVIALLASCLTGGIATAHAFAEILQGRLTPPHPPPNALPPTVPPEPSPFSCRADPAVEIARGVNVAVGRPTCSAASTTSKFSARVSLTKIRTSCLSNAFLFGRPIFRAYSKRSRNTIEFVSIWDS